MYKISVACLMCCTFFLGYLASKSEDEIEYKYRGQSEAKFKETATCVKKLREMIMKDSGKEINENEEEDTRLGDMNLNLKQCETMTEYYQQTHSSRDKRKALDFNSDPWSMWELPINYHIMDGYFSDTEKRNIRNGFKNWEKKTCIRFQEVPSSFQGIKVDIFGKEQGCWSSVGFQTFHQPMNLQSGSCSSVMGVIEHEIGHLLGMFHEHQRPDRNDYITVHRGNIQPMRLENFVMLIPTIVYGVPYDYASVMHYGTKFYTINSEYTITSNDPLYQHSMGQRIGASFMDVAAVNRMYGCLNTVNAPASCKTSSLVCVNGGYPNPGLLDGVTPCSTCLCPDGLKGDCSQPDHGSTGCVPQSGTLDVTSTSEKCVTSPGYPSSFYRTGERCNWMLKSRTGSNIELRFDTSEGICLPHTQGDLQCIHYVEIRYNGNITVAGPRFCGCSSHLLNLNQRLVSKSNKVLITFRSEQQNGMAVVQEKRGFKLCYRLAGGVTQPPRSTTTFLPRSTTTQPSTTSTTVSSTISATTTTSATTTSTAASSTTSRPTALPWSTTTTTTTRSITPVSPTAHHGYYCHVCQAKYKYVCRLPNTVKRCAPGQACFSQLYWRGGGNNMYIVKKCVNWCSNPGYVYQSGGLVRYCCYGDLCNFSDIHYK